MTLPVAPSQLTILVCFREPRHRVSQCLPVVWQRMLAERRKMLDSRAFAFYHWRRPTYFLRGRILVRSMEGLFFVRTFSVAGLTSSSGKGSGGCHRPVPLRAKGGSP
jgi:hypothetical protein